MSSYRSSITIKESSPELVQLNVRVSLDVRRKLRIALMAENISIDAWLEIQAVEWLKKRGVDALPAPRKVKGKRS